METPKKWLLLDAEKECNEWIYNFVVNDPERMKRISDPELFKLLLRNLWSEYNLDNDDVREISAFTKDFIERRDKAIIDGEREFFVEEYQAISHFQHVIPQVNDSLSETLMFDPEDEDSYDDNPNDPYSQYFDQYTEDKESDYDLLDE